jgi:hypothetical protein
MLVAKQHIRHYTNFRNAHCSHAEYIRDNNLSDAVGDFLRTSYLRILRGERFSDIIREMDTKIVKMKDAEEAKLKRGRRHKASNDPEMRRLIREIARIRRVNRILRKRKRN